MQAGRPAGKTPALSLTGEDRAPGAVGRDPGEVIVVHDDQRRGSGQVASADGAERDGRLRVVERAGQELRRAAGAVDGVPEEAVARGIEPDDPLPLERRVIERFRPLHAQVVEQGANDARARSVGSTDRKSTRLNSSHGYIPYA